MSVLNGPGEGTWSVFAEKVVGERDAAVARADAAEANVQRMLAQARKIVERYDRDAENARKHRLEWAGAAVCEARAARSMLDCFERAAKAEAHPAVPPAAGEVAGG